MGEKFRKSDQKNMSQTAQTQITVLQPETQIKTSHSHNHRKKGINFHLVHTLSIISGFFGILFTILEFDVWICILFDLISVLSAIFAVVTERRHKKKWENSNNKT